MPSRLHGSRIWKSSVVVLSSVAGSTALAVIFKLQDRAHFLPFIVGVIVSAWYGGLVPGLSATFLSVLVADYMFAEPIHSILLNDPWDVVLLILFLIIGIAISFLFHWLQTSNLTLRETNVRLRRSNEELERFSFILAHDLLEPVRSISAMTQLFLSRNESNLDKESVQMLNFAVGGADRMKKLVTDILEFAKVSHEATEHEVDARAVAEAAVRDLNEAVVQSGAKVVVHSLPILQTNEGHLLRLFLNLIGNAIKYRGENPPEVHISAASEGNEWVFSIRDNGIGIDPKYHDQIFDPFHRLHSASEYEGSGVGLAICKRIVERHHGRIWVESKHGKGATFHFTMPKTKSAELSGERMEQKPNRNSGDQNDERGRAAAG